VWNTSGTIAFAARNIMIASTLLALVIIVPVLVYAFVVARKYRAGNRALTKNPENNAGTRFVILFWLAPAFIVFIFTLIIWRTAHSLDPSKPIVSENPPITIQVVALRWKWLFIYPQQHIASVNFIQIPVNTPIHFVLTADAPMNSFWIPQLGTQMYAMTGMSTQLYLMADKEGDFVGSAAEINGAGFSGMRFITRSSSKINFDQWIDSVKHATSTLSREEYAVLSLPSENNPPKFYSSVDENMYTDVIAKYIP
jgi:cytochrome o ubiquinol oxidase subunit 2